MTAGPDKSGIDKALALELSMNGVLPFDDWVSVNTRKAEAMFGNQGVQPGAIWLSALHPRALEYLEQAPVLALAATFGGKASSRSERAYVAMNFKPMIERGARLKDVMKAFRVAYPLRAISAKAIRPGVWGVLQAITRLVDFSTISQSIPDVQTRHMHWLAGLGVFWSELQRRAPDEQANGAILRWAMLALSRAIAAKQPVGSECGELADFLICNRDQFNPRWTWRKLIEESAIWHEALANAQIDRINDGTYDAAVAYPGFPTEVTLAGFDFYALRSLRALVVEGKAMHHCVASYYPDIQSGRARIYSIRKDGKRIATVEFARSGEYNPRGVGGGGSYWKAVQVKGVLNARPSKDVIEVAEQFARAVSDNLIPMKRDAEARKAVMAARLEGGRA